MAICYKDTRQHDEFNDAEVVDPRLYGMIHALAAFCERMFGKDVWITCVKDDGVRGRASSSPHVIGPGNPRVRAVDVRAHHGYWQDSELRAIKNWLKINFPRSDMSNLEVQFDGWYGTLRHHGVGLDEHLHITVEPLEQLRRAIRV